MDDYRGAIEDCNKFIEINPNDENTFYLRGKAKLQLEGFKGAIEDCNRSIELNSKDEDAYFLRGSSKLMLDEKESSCMDYSIAGELGHDRAYEMVKKYCNQQNSIEDVVKTLL